MFNLAYAIKSWDKKGDIVHDTPLREGNSFVRNTWNMWTNQYVGYPTGNYESGGTAVKKTSGTIYNSGESFTMGRTDNGGGTDIGFMSGRDGESHGIVVSTSDTAESFEDYLANRVGIGNDAGQLYYNQHQKTVSSYDAPTKTWTMKRERYFNNNTDATITVKSIGLYTKLRIDGADTGDFLFARDVLGTAVPVLAAGQLLVTYELQIVLPI